MIFHHGYYYTLAGFLIGLFSSAVIAAFLLWLHIREEYVTVKINAKEVLPDKMDGLTKYLHEMGYFDIATTEKLICAKKFYSPKTGWSYEKEDIKFYVNGKKFRNGRNFYVHIYLGEEIKIKALEQHCFEILTYLVGKTRARLLTNHVN